jgi:DNA-binding MarR family transcriptional regulator
MQSSIEHQLFIQMQRLASTLAQQAAELLKTQGLSIAQYNVLRVLRGAAREGAELACGEVADRLISKDPDMTRLLDRLENQGLVSRERSKEDRRVVTASITDKGLAVLAELDEPMAQLHQEQLGHLGEERSRKLLDLLDAAATRSSS